MSAFRKCGDADIIYYAPFYKENQHGEKQSYIKSGRACTRKTRAHANVTHSPRILLVLFK